MFVDFVVLGVTLKLVNGGVECIWASGVSCVTYVMYTNFLCVMAHQVNTVAWNVWGLGDAYKRQAVFLFTCVNISLRLCVFQRIILLKIGHIYFIGPGLA